MQWYRRLTSKQQRLLLSLTLAVIIVLGLLGVTIWVTLRSLQATSPLQPEPSRSILASPAPSPTLLLSPSPTPSPVPDFETSEAGRISEEVSAARGALTRWSTPLTLVDRHDLTTALYNRYQAVPPLAVQMRPVLKALDLWWWEDPLRMDYRAQAYLTAALYVPEEGQIYLRRDWEGARDTLETQLAYGYARAIPEQYGDIQSLIEGASTLDHRIALAATADGDALMALWLTHDIDPESQQADELFDVVVDAVTPRWQYEDPLLDDLSALSLHLGRFFATQRYRSGGVEALDAALLRPPRSTQQLLHPERYVTAEELPLMQLIEPDLSSGWTLTCTETLGEALMGLVLLEWDETTVWDDTLLHWSGDLLQVWQGPEEAQVMVWHSVWDDWRVARQFVEQVTPLVLDRIPGIVLNSDPVDGLPRGRWWSGRNGAAFIYRYADRVWLVWGEDTDVVTSVSAALLEVR